MLGVDKKGTAGQHDGQCRLLLAIRICRCQMARDAVRILSAFVHMPGRGWRRIFLEER